MKMGLLRSCFKAKADLVIKVEKGKCGPTIGQSEITTSGTSGPRILSLGGGTIFDKSEKKLIKLVFRTLTNPIKTQFGIKFCAAPLFFTEKDRKLRL